MALREPPLNEAHAARDAQTTEFGGWEMPVEFDSIRTEHESVRESVGKFDVSHMGEIEVSGPDADELMGRLTSNDMRTLESGHAQYAMITDSEGVIIDDTMVYRLPADHDAEFLFVPNAGHDAQMEDRWTTHRDEWNLDASVENRTDEYAMIAVQGPDAEELVGAATDGTGDAADLSPFAATTTTVADIDCFIARTGYTGEDGFELVYPWKNAEAVWDAFDCQPCGLGARDTLRLEAGLLLSGQDFDPDENPRNPYEAGVGFAVDLDTEFVGRDALAAVDESGPDEQLVGFELTARGVPRHGYDITVDGETVGTVTSGTASPTLSTSIGLGYVPTPYADPDTEVDIEIRGESKEAHIRALPFYQR